MKLIAELGKVLALYTESDPITQWFKQEKEKNGLFSASDYSAIRPVQAEAEAVGGAITYAELTGCPLHFVHNSSVLAIEEVELAKQKGGAKCAQPLREREEQERLITSLMGN
ncbi:hypothetical protein [Peribacillus simplex]|uniref:hypothetical protein n=1 Tax=Peribacillus simplex TaxID=1478 RepID=UPI003D2C099D